VKLINLVYQKNSDEVAVETYESSLPKKSMILHSKKKLINFYKKEMCSQLGLEAQYLRKLTSSMCRPRPISGAAQWNMAQINGCNLQWIVTTDIGMMSINLLLIMDLQVFFDIH
jgi:hypothetical protein